MGRNTLGAFGTICSLETKPGETGQTAIGRTDHCLSLSSERERAQSFGSTPGTFVDPFHCLHTRRRWYPDRGASKVAETDGVRACRMPIEVSHGSYVSLLQRHVIACACLRRLEHVSVSPTPCTTSNRRVSLRSGEWASGMEDEVERTCVNGSRGFVV